MTPGATGERSDAEPIAFDMPPARMGESPLTAAFTVAPNWVGEVLSSEPSRAEPFDAIELRLEWLSAR